MQVGELIRRTRGTHGVSQRSLAIRAGTDAFGLAGTMVLGFATVVETQLWRRGAVR